MHKFPLGEIDMSCGIMDRCSDDERFAQFVMQSLDRHSQCDWGDIEKEDRQRNDMALRNGERLLSVYYFDSQESIWILTEWDRSATTILYPDTNMILCNNIPQVDECLLYNIENGDFITYYDENGDECDEENAVDQSENDIFQWYIIDNSTAERLKRSTNELIFDSEKLDVYVLGVTHCGTAWDYVGAEFIY